MDVESRYLLLLDSTVHGSTPLHFAARSGSMECVRELLAWGAERNVRDINGYSSDSHILILVTLVILLEILSYM